MTEEREDRRPDPEALLKAIQKEETQAGRGRLKIFFGACAGVGKTYAMLSEARSRRKQGTDVVIGIAETHERAETGELLDGFEVLPRKKENGRIAQHEFDMEAALARRPQLLIVDELAHTNLRGSRHAKRWQDVEELLDAGIDVYTALNVQHLESLNDIVAEVTGITVRETVPDRIFSDAAEVKLVDLPVAELLRRLEDGKIYLPEVARRASRNFFREGNLIALRELALRCTADRVDAQMRAYRAETAVEGIWETQERFLVAIGDRSEDAKLVRETARLANRLKSEWIAVHAERSQVSDEAKKRVFSHLKLAEELGAETVLLSGSDTAGVIADFAVRRNVTKAVIGVRKKRRLIPAAGLAERIQKKAPGIDVLQIALPDGKEEARAEKNAFPAGNYVKAVLLWAVAMSAAAALLAVFEPANVIIVLFLATVAAGGFYGAGPAALVTLLSALAFDFFYVPPVLEFTGNSAEYLFTFVLVLAAGVYVGRLSGRLRGEAENAGKRDFASTAVAGLAKQLSASLTREQAETVLEKHLGPILDAQIRLALPSGKSGQIALLSNDTADLEVAQWSFDHGREAGAGTQTLSASPARCVPLKTSKSTLGVLILYPKEASALENPENRRLLDVCAAQAAQTLERLEYSEVARETLVKTESEKIRVTLLRTISRDMKQPLESILKAVGRLRPNLQKSENSVQLSLIQGQTALLKRLSASLDEMARLRTGAEELNMETLDLQELIRELVARYWSIDSDRTIETEADADLPKVTADRALLRKALENLIDNAVKYSPAEQPIRVEAKVSEGGVAVCVRDHGTGLPAAVRAVSEKAEQDRSDAVRSSGLGLALVRLIASAHRGRVTTENCPDGGAAVTLWLPRNQSVQ